MQSKNTLVVEEGQLERTLFLQKLQGTISAVKQLVERAKELAGSTLRFDFVTTMALETVQNVSQDIKRFKEEPTADNTASAIVHDVNNMLATIIGRIQLAVAVNAEIDGQDEAGKEKKRAEVRDHLSCALEAACVSSKIIDGQDHRNCDATKEHLQASLERALELSQTEQEVEVITYFPKEPVFVGMAQKDLMRLFSNLIKNAHYAVGENKNQDRTLGIFVDVSGKMVEVHVIDNGPGIHAALQESIFEAGVTTKGDDGSGFGLYSCRDIVSRYGGKIGVESTRGAGATFRVELPMARA